MRIPVGRAVKTLREGGIVPFSYYTARHFQVYRPVWNTITSRYQFGTNIFERDWDLLIILDACRYDRLREISTSKSWVKSVSQFRSVGSTSAEWTLKTFDEKYRNEIAQTAFISRNIWSQRILDERLHKQQGHDYSWIRSGRPQWNPVSPDAFAHYERVQPIANQDNRLHPQSTAIPHIVTDRAISIGRNKDVDRMIVWYSMPHTKFIGDALEWTVNEPSTEDLMAGPDHTRNLRPEEESYRPVRQGEVEPEKVRKLYRKNLEFVLKYVEILLENIDAEKPVISADHGEGLGEGFWGHPAGYPTGPVKTVPWGEANASDTETYESQYDELARAPEEQARKQILKDMGYI